MRRVLAAVIMASFVLAWPAHAQLFPTTPVADPTLMPATEHVLVDTTLWVSPPSSEGLCMVLDAGQVNVTVKRVQDAPEQRPTAFDLNGFMPDPDANLKLPLVVQEVSGSTRVKGAGYYCWRINVNAPETRTMNMVERSPYVQQIAIRMTLQP